MPTYWMPVYGTGCNLGCCGLSALMDCSVSAPKTADIFWYCGIW